MIKRALIVFIPLIGLLVLINPLIPVFIIAALVISGTIIAILTAILTAILWVFDPKEAKKRVKEFFGK